MNWTRAENVVWEELDGGALLVRAATGERWTLNAAACALWKLCDGRGTAELAALLKHSREEIADFCRQFGALGLLRPALIPVPIHGANSIVTARSGPLGFQTLGLGNGPRRRASARGISAPF